MKSIFLIFMKKFPVKICYKNREKLKIHRKFVETNAKLETLSAIMKQEKEQLNEKLNLQKEKNEEEREAYERKIMELKELFEKRLKDHDKWSKKYEDENGQLKDVIDFIRKEDSQGTSQKKNKGKLEGNPEMNKEVVGVLGQIKEMMKEMRELKSEALENKALCEKEKELRDVEKKFLRQINDAKILSENTLETVKKSFYTEIQVLKAKRIFKKKIMFFFQKEDKKQMEKQRENNLLSLLEKEGQIKVLQEKIISYEKEKKSQIDHAELLCKVKKFMDLFFFLKKF